MEALRSQLAEYGHPDIIVHVDRRWRSLANWLPNYFADAVREGATFRAEQTVQVGWSVIKLKAATGGDLVAFEPDFLTMPIHWVEGINGTVRLLALQQAVCDECDVEPCFPSILQPVFSTEVMPSSDQFTMVRSANGANHSGWSFHEPHDEGGRLLSLYEAATINDGIVPFVALPMGSVIERNGNELSIELDGRSVPTGSSDLLSRLAARSSLDDVASRLAAND